MNYLTEHRLFVLRRWIATCDYLEVNLLTHYPRYSVWFTFIDYHHSQYDENGYKEYASAQLHLCFEWYLHGLYIYHNAPIKPLINRNEKGFLEVYGYEQGGTRPVLDLPRQTILTLALASGKRKLTTTWDY